MGADGEMVRYQKENATDLITKVDEREDDHDLVGCETDDYQIESIIIKNSRRYKIST